MWTNVSVNFIEGRPAPNGYKLIMVIVYRLIKYAHFVSMKHSFTAIVVIKTFIANVVHLHGILTSIVSDRDKIFISWVLFGRHCFASPTGYPALHEFKLPSSIRLSNWGNKLHLRTILSLLYRWSTAKVDGMDSLTMSILNYNYTIRVYFALPWNLPHNFLVHTKLWHINWLFLLNLKFMMYFMSQ